MKVLITGNSSLPGYRATLAMLGRGFEVIGTYLTHEIPLEHDSLTKVRADIRNFNELSELFKKYKPEVVLHMAAYGDVDGCEKNRDLAWDVNVRGTTNVVRLASKFSEYILYLSTDYVFDGLKGEYREFDPPNPINYYGLTKLCGEIVVMSSDIKHSIVRASSIYGFGPGRENFAKLLVKKLGKKEPVRAIYNQYTSPTQATLLAKAILEIVEKRLTGIFHIVGERMSRFEFALKIAEALRLDKSLIKQASMEEMKWFAKRPTDSSLSANVTKKQLEVDFFSMEEAMKTLQEEYLTLER